MAKFPEESFPESTDTARDLALCWALCCALRALAMISRGLLTLLIPSDVVAADIAWASRSVPRRLADVPLISSFVAISLRQHGHSLCLFTSHSRMQAL